MIESIRYEVGVVSIIVEISAAEAEIPENIMQLLSLFLSTLVNVRVLSV